MQAVEDIIKRAPVVDTEPPRPLRRELPPPDAFPLSALGGILQPAAAAIEDRIQAPLSICGQSVLATAALAVQAHADVLLPFGQTRPLSAFFVSVAESGDRKTSADAEALWPVRKYEQNLLIRHREERTSYVNRQATWDAERRNILSDKLIDATVRRQQLEDLGAEPPAPLEPLLTSPDPTFEGLIKQFVIGRPSLGLFSDEGGQFIGGHGMNADNRLKTAAALSALWDGQALRRVRAGDGVLILPGRRLTQHVMIQPSVAPQLLADPLLSGQGLLSRLLPVAPPSIAGTRLWREQTPESDQAIKRFGARLLSILEADIPLREGTTNELQPRTLPLSAEAREVWIRFADHIERQVGTGGNLEPIRPFAAKAAEHAARLGAILALVADLEAGELTRLHLEAGIELTQFYLSEWLRLHDAGATRPELLRAERLLHWLASTWTGDVIGLRDVYRLGPNTLRNVKDAREAVAVLEEHGWLKREPGGCTVNGTYSREAWRLATEVRP